jgi:tetrahydromethanopterin S-methyltransferase subunit E
LFWFGQIIAGTPTVVMMLNAVLAGVIAAIAVVRIGAAPGTALIVGAAGFAVAAAAHSVYSRQTIGKAIGAHRPLFPHPGSPSS